MLNIIFKDCVRISRPTLAALEGEFDQVWAELCDKVLAEGEPCIGDETGALSPGDALGRFWAPHAERRRLGLAPVQPEPAFEAPAEPEPEPTFEAPAEPEPAFAAPEEPAEPAFEAPEPAAKEAKKPAPEPAAKKPAAKKPAAKKPAAKKPAAKKPAKSRAKR